MGKLNRGGGNSRAVRSCRGSENSTVSTITGFPLAKLFLGGYTLGLVSLVLVPVASRWWGHEIQIRITLQ